MNDVEVARRADKEVLAAEAWRAIDSWNKDRDNQIDFRRVRWYYDCYDGMFWDDQDITTEIRAYINFVFSQAQLRIALNNTNRPSITFSENDHGDAKQVEDIQEDWDSTYEQSGFEYERLLCTKDSYLAGTGIAKVVDGPRFEVINPFQFLISPGARDINYAFGCAHVQMVHLHTAREIANRWAEYEGNEVKPVIEDIKPGVIREFADFESMRTKYGTREKAVTYETNPIRTYAADVGGSAQVGPSDMVTVGEVYTRSESGIMLTVVMGMECVYYGPAPIRSVLPFAAYRPFPTSTRFWGPSFVRVFESELQWVAKLLSIGLEGAIDAATTLILAASTSNIDLESIRGGRGAQIVTYNPGAPKPEIAQYSKVPGEIFQMIPMLRGLMEDSTGKTDAIRGLNPTGVTSGDQLSQLIEAGTTFIRPEIQALERGDEDLAKVWAAAKGYDGILRKVTVDPGSTAGFRRNRMAAMAVQLGAQGYFGPPRAARKVVLKTLKWPDYEEVVKDAEAEESRIEQLMQGAPPQAGRGGSPKSFPAMNGGPSSANGGLL